MTIRGSYIDVEYFEIFANFVGISKTEFDHYTFETYIRLLIHLRNKL